MEEFGDLARSKPRLSFSSISDTTVNSSLVNRMIVENSTTNNNNFAIENFVRDSGGAAPQNFRIEGSSGIRVGDAIYHIYYPPNNEDRAKRDSNSFKGTEDELIRTSEPKKKFKLTKLHVAIVVLVVILISTATTLSIFLIPNNDPQETTTSHFDSTTSNEITTKSEETTTESYTTTPNEEPFEIISRAEWTSDPINPDISTFTNFSFPIRRIIVGQTDDSETCMNKTECISKVQAIKNRHPTLLDIPWNFLIGGDGKVYEGRGYQYEGEHTENINASIYNEIGIGIGFIGNFSTQAPSALMMDGFRNFIEKSIENGNFSTAYKIFLQDQLAFKEIEACELKNALSEMENYYEIEKIYKREEWEGMNSKAIYPITNPLDQVVIHHSGTGWLCADEANCTNSMRILQRNAINAYGWDEINYNFVIGGADDYAIVMEGRGFNNRGAHTPNMNSISLGIGLIGSFDIHEPGSGMMSVLRKFIDDAFALGKLKENYKLLVRRDIEPWSVSPGDNVIDIVKNWPDFSVPDPLP